MTFDELSQEQKTSVKKEYMLRLADRGIFIRTIYGGGNMEGVMGEERGPSLDELEIADELVPDELAREEGGGMYMTFDELSRDQKIEVKQKIIEKRNEARGEGTSCDELANADNLVSDEDAREWAEGTVFVPEDFGPESNGQVPDVAEFARSELTTEKYKAEHPEATWLHDPLVCSAVTAALSWAKRKISERYEAK